MKGYGEYTRRFITGTGQETKHATYTGGVKLAQGHSCRPSDNTRLKMLLSLSFIWQKLRQGRE